MSTPGPSDQLIDSENFNSELIFRPLEIIEIYEEQNGVFKSLNLCGYEIRQTISATLLQELNISLDQLFINDYNSFSMIIAAFFGRKYALDIPKEKKDEIGKIGNLQNENHPTVVNTSNGVVPNAFTNQLLVHPEVQRQYSRLSASSPIPQKEHHYKEIDLLPDCPYPLHTVMVMCYAAHFMKTLFLDEGPGQELEHAKFDNLKKHLQDVACRVVNHIYHLPRGPKLVRDVLQADYNPDRPKEKNTTTHRDYLKKKFNQSKEIMAIAYQAEAMKFLSQKPCSNLVAYRYASGPGLVGVGKSGIPISRKIFSGKKSGSRFPENVFPSKPDSGHRTEKKCGYVLSCLATMKAKLWLHAIFRIIYIFAFSYMLCRVPIYDDYRGYNLRRKTDIVATVYVLTVLLAQFLMTIIKLFNYMKFVEPTKKNFARYLKLNKLAFCRIILITSVLGLEAFRLSLFVFYQFFFSERFNFDGVWVFIPLMLELLYCSLFIISAISSLRFFYLFESLGFFTHLIKKMLKTVGMFVCIFCAFWFVLAVTHVSLSRAFTSTNNTFVHTISSQGKFEIFGEVQDVDRTGNLPECVNYTKTGWELFTMDYMEASCLFRSSVLPFLVFVYIFLAGILLVNLLTAQLTKEYEIESENSRYYGGYLQYQQLCKIESKICLPPPLSIFYIAIILMLAVAALFFKMLKMLRIGCCCDAIFRWLWTHIIEKMDGYPYQAVREDARQLTEDDKTIITELLKKTVENPWTKMKELIERYEERDSRNFAQAQLRLNELFVLRRFRGRKRFTGGRKGIMMVTR